MDLDEDLDADLDANMLFKDPALDVPFFGDLNEFKTNILTFIVSEWVRVEIDILS